MSVPPVDKWNIDRFGNHTESHTQRYFETRADNIDLKPIPNETLNYYTRRVMTQIKKYEEIAIEAHIYGRKMWHTHKNPSGCWICDSITYLWQIHDILHKLPDNTYKFDETLSLIPIQPST